MIITFEKVKAAHAIVTNLLAGQAPSDEERKLLNELSPYDTKKWLIDRVATLEAILGQFADLRVLTASDGTRWPIGTMARMALNGATAEIIPALLELHREVEVPQKND